PCSGAGDGRRPRSVADRDAGLSAIGTYLPDPRGTSLVDVLAVHGAADRRTEDLAEVQRIEDRDPREFALEGAGAQVLGRSAGDGGSVRREIDRPDRGVHRLLDALAELPLRTALRGKVREHERGAMIGEA